MRKKSFHGNGTIIKIWTDKKDGLIVKAGR
jgi:hypothetical protein